MRNPNSRLPFPKVYDIYTHSSLLLTSQQKWVPSLVFWILGPLTSSWCINYHRLLYVQLLLLSISPYVPKCSASLDKESSLILFSALVTALGLLFWSKQTLLTERGVFFISSPTSHNNSSNDSNKASKPDSVDAFLAPLVLSLAFNTSDHLPFLALSSTGFGDTTLPDAPSSSETPS